ncbi:MAG TPA: DUF6084 family protein [Ktedonobacteraceae bacterium]|nr:DUF6084 family protein [Ktedonobacteraceae bacterium]
MPDLDFEIVGAEVPPYAAVPSLTFKMRIVNREDSPMRDMQRIHSVALRCQLQLAVTRRHYNPEEQVALLDVFGEPKRWGDTLRNLLWTHVSTVVPQFSGSTIVDLPVPCTYDFEVVSTKYFNALENGDIPLLFLFSGTIFYAGEEGNLQAGQISWSKEASYRLPVTLWQEMIARYYPNSTWIRLQKDVFDQLFRYKAVHGLPTWENVVERLLRESSEEVQS